MKNQILWPAIALAAVAASCKDDGPNFTTLQPEQGAASLYTLPTGYTAENVDSATLAMTNVASNITTTYRLGTAGTDIRVEDGLYNMTLTAWTHRTVAGKTVTETLRDGKQNVNIGGGSFPLSFTLVRVGGGQGFVLAEICTTAKPAEGQSSYPYSGYFRIYNNSADTLYADGLCIFESAWTSVNKQAYTPDIMSEAVAVWAVYQIPGSGRDVKVAPGASLVIADQAIDHTQANPNAYDLSRANFEWYDETTRNLDIDNLDVPNLLKVYCSSATVWVPSIQNNRSYGIGWLGGSRGAISNEQYISDYKYDYSYVTPLLNGGTREMNGSAYKIPNDWILDFVNTSPRTQHAWTLCAPSVDAGYVSLGETGKDANCKGKAARRKFANGQMVDTNNSTEDMEVVDADPWHVFQ